MSVTETPDQAYIDKKIKEAVTFALVNEKLKEHDKRISGLESFRWWLMGGVVTATLGSWGTLVLFLVEKSLK